MHCRIGALLLAATGLAGTAFGQVVELPDPVPENVLSDPSSGVVRPWRVWANMRGSAVHWGSDKQSEVRRGMRFLEPAYVAARKTVGGREVMLLADAVGREDGTARIVTFHGWVAESQLLTQRSARRVRRQGRELVIHRKGMSVVTKKSIEQFGPDQVKTDQVGAAGQQKDKGAAVAGEYLSVYLAPRMPKPGDPTDFARPLRLFSFYYVFGETDDWVLVGSGQDIIPNKDGATETVKGWLPRPNHAEWSNRIGFEWANDAYRRGPQPPRGGRNEPGFVFASATDALQYLASPTPLPLDPNGKHREPRGSVFVETIKDGMSIRLPNHAMRMPALTATPATTVRGNELYNVGWRGVTPVDEQNRAVVRARLERIQKSLRHLDVMFLIDHTKTMETHFQTVAASVQRIVKDLRANYLTAVGDQQRTMRLSISFYGDEKTAGRAVIRRLRTVPLEAEDPRVVRKQLDELAQRTPRERPAFAKDLTVGQMLAELPGHETHGGGGLEDDLFSGLEDAVRTLPDDSTQKLLFVIGDMADKSTGQREQTLRDRVSTLLTDREVPIRLVVLRVPTEAATKSANGLKLTKVFETQMLALIRSAAAKAEKQGWKNALTEFYLYNRLGENPQFNLSQRIYQQYNEVQKRTSALLAKLRRVDPSQLTENERMRLGGINLDLLQVPLFRKGYVWKAARKAAISKARQPHVPVVNTRVLLAQADLNNLKIVLGRFITAAENNRAGGSLGSVVRQVVTDVFGEDKTIVSVKSAFEAKAGIPIRSEVLKRTFEQLNDPIRPKELAEIKVAFKRIESLLEDTEQVWEAEFKGGEWSVVSVGEPVPNKPRWFKRLEDPTQTRWYWVKEEELP